MKRILFFVSALAGLFLAASCQQENLEPVVDGGVTYTISLPATVQTKGEDGYNSYDLYYEVYKTVDAAALEAATKPLFEDKVTMTGNTTTVILDLLNNQDYTVLFWANNAGADYFTLGDLRKVGVKSAGANDDDRDAFCGKDQIIGHKAGQSKTVTLTRPFAQVNIATLVNDDNYNIEVVSSLVTFKKIPMEYNVFDKSVSNESDVTFSVRNSPAGNLVDDYRYVAMNYVLVPTGNIEEVYYEINTTTDGVANRAITNSVYSVPVKANYRTNIIGNLLTSNATYTVEIKPGFEEAEEYEIWDGEFISAPAKNAAGEYEVTKPSELAWLAAAVNGTIETRATEPAKTFAGETFVLTENIDLGNFPWTPIGLTGDSEGFQGTFDGNGKTISNLYVDLTAEPKYQSAGLFGSARVGEIKNFTVKNAVVKNITTGSSSGASSCGTAVVVGSAQTQTGHKITNVHVINATVEGNRYCAAIAGYYDGAISDCTVDNVTIKVSPDKLSGTYDNGDKAGGILGYANTGVGTTIADCVVKNSTIEGYRDLGGIAGLIRKSVTGCTVENVNIVHNPLNGYKTSVTTFGAIHSGYVTPEVETGNTVTNVTIYAPENVTIVKPGESLQAAIDAAAAPAVIYLAEGTHTGHTVINKEITLLPVEGAKVVYDGHLHINNTTALIKNITLTNEHPSTTTVQASGDAHLSCASSYSSNVTMENCTFNISDMYGFYNYQGVSEQIVIKNCTFNCNGKRPLYTRTIVEVDGCKFYDQYRYAIQVAGELQAQQVVTFTNNQIINPCVTSGKGFVAGVSISGSRKCENVTFNIANNTLQSSLFPSMIYVYDKSDNINIASCTVNGATFVREDMIEMAYKVSNDAELAKAISSVTDDWTIILEQGTYNNDINLTVAALGAAKGNLVFKAAEGANPVITGTVTMGYFENRVGAVAWNGKVTFDGITFDHANPLTHSLSIQNLLGLTLRNCTVIGDGEYGISAPGSNPTGLSSIVNCNFVNAGLQLGGNFATGLVIDDCTFDESCINVQGGNSVTIQNCSFENTLTNSHVGESFYLVRSNATPITVKNCVIAIDSELSEVATAQEKWGILWNRKNLDWTVENVDVTMTDAALMQTDLLVTKCTSTGKINTTNLTVNGIVQ